MIKVIGGPGAESAGKSGWAGGLGVGRRQVLLPAWARGGCARRGGTASKLGVGPPPPHPARFGVSGDVTAGTQPPLAPSNPHPRGGRDARPLPARQTSWRLGSGAARSQPARREGRGAGRAGGGRAARHAVQPSQRPAQPWSSSSSALRDPRPCPCPCRAASSEAREVSPPPAGFLRRARHPHLHPASCTSTDCPRRQRPARGPNRWRRAAPSLPHPSPVPAENNGANAGVSALHWKPSRALWNGPFAAAPAAAGLSAGMGGGRLGKGERRRWHLETPALPARLDPSLERSRRAGMRRGLSLDQRGRGGMERREDLDGGMGEGRGCSGPTLGEGAQGGGSCPGPQGRRGQRLSQKPNRRAGEARGGCCRKARP